MAHSTLAFMILRLACMGHGWRLRTSSAERLPRLEDFANDITWGSRRVSDEHRNRPLSALANFFLAFNPAPTLRFTNSRSRTPAVGAAQTRLFNPAPTSRFINSRSRTIAVHAAQTRARSAPVLMVSDWWNRPIGAPYAAGTTTYDPIAANKFYGDRLPVVLSRLWKLTASTFTFNIRLLFDYLAYSRAGKPEGESWPNEKDRAKESLDIATQLGTTFIKLAQALSIRLDLIPEAYAQELRQLQDAVPPFDSEEAKEIIARELGVKGGAAGLNSIFQSLSDKPLAAASIGQVYKGVLKDGRTVAVKVQRPNILDEIALDLYLLRLLAPLQTKVSNFINKIKTYPDDIRLAQELVDEWGRGFVAEADYFYEAANTKSFSEAMVRRGLAAVTSPIVIDELSTEKILVTEWVDGTRLDLDASPDVPRLCGVAINAYLTMLLDTGVLHCDPHPGNLLRTTDGKLCILDWGMTLGVPSDLQYALIEFIAHVNSEDYDAIPMDFVNLGFTPPEQIERVRDSNLGEGLAFVLRQLSQGGGGKKMSERVAAEWREQYDPEGVLTDEELKEKLREEFTNQARAQLEAEGVEGVDVMEVQNVLETMQQRNRELFKVPPYILYVTRAFATLEGIGLSANEDYSIVSEAFPYLSKRLFTDDSPRAKAALRSMLYGSENKDASNASPNITKMLSMGEGFASYSSVTSQVPTDSKSGDTVVGDVMGTGALGVDTGAGNKGIGGNATVDAAADDLVDLLLSADGNYVQELLLEEAAKLVDARVRDTLAQAGTSAPLNALADALRAPKQIADSTVGRLPLPHFMKDALDVALTPAKTLDDLSRVIPTLTRTAKTDEESLQNFNALWEKLNPSATDEDGANKTAMSTDSEDNGILGSFSPPSLDLPPALASVQTNAGPILEQLGDPESSLRRRLPLVGTLSRRFGATLLRRVATRLEEDANRPDASSLARDVAARTVEADRNLAALIEPEMPKKE